MAIPRFYLSGPLSSGETIDLPDALFRHAVQVLRLKTGAALTLFNGDGGEYAATLSRVGRRDAAVNVGARAERDAESPLRVCLAQALAQGERMDFVLQKAVELGVDALQPLYTERSVSRLDAERLAKRMRHWRGVIAGGCEQCGRNRLPRLAEPLSLDAWLNDVVNAEPAAALKLMLHPDADTTTTLATLPPANANATEQVALLVGPEGGFSDVELDAARRRGFSALRLGPRVLRTETAGLAALAALQTLRGDF